MRFLETSFKTPQKKTSIKFGRFIRAHRLDELPQLFNVLYGNMSLVGPRPEQIGLTEKYLKTIDNFELRCPVKPRITGLAQITQGNVTSDSEVKKKLKLDLVYIKNRSIIFDFNMLALTTIVVSKGLEK